MTEATVREGSGAQYIGVFAVIVAAMPICLIASIDLLTMKIRNADQRANKHKRRRV